jgi:hypothetical protein
LIGLRVTGCGLRVTGYGLRVAASGFRPTANDPRPTILGPRFSPFVFGPYSISANKLKKLANQHIS